MEGLWRVFWSRKKRNTGNATSMGIDPHVTVIKVRLSTYQFPRVDKSVCGHAILVSL